jgi:hypothetical protein
MRTLVLVFSLLVSATAPALAAGETGVVVVGEATMQPQVAAQLEAWLRNHGYALAAAPLPPTGISTLVDCFVVEDEGCARKVFENQSMADSLVFAKIDLQEKGDSPERTIALTAYWFVRGETKATAERRFCERCTDQSLRAATEDLITALATNLKIAPGRIEITSTPAGARVSVDGELIGETPLSHDLAAGDHTIAISHDDHAVATRTVAIRTGATTRLEVPLDSLEQKDSSRVLPLAVLGAGAALAITGGILIAIDEDESPMGSYRIRDTARAGVVTLAVGGVALAVGGYLWFSSSKASGPVASASGDGGYIGWIGSF